MYSESWDRDVTSNKFNLQTFQKHVLAANYADKENLCRWREHKRFMPVLSRECSRKGHRYFVVEDLHTFYKKYMNMNCKDLTFYETIRTDFACRLYFDIEFDKSLNPGSDGEASMVIFKKCLIA